MTNEVIGLLRLGFDAAGEQLSMCLTAELRDEPTAMPETARQVLDAVTAEWSLHHDGVGLELRISPRRDRTAPP